MDLGSLKTKIYSSDVSSTTNEPFICTSMIMSPSDISCVNKHVLGWIVSLGSEVLAISVKAIKTPFSSLTTTSRNHASLRPLLAIVQIFISHFRHIQSRLKFPPTFHFTVSISTRDKLRVSTYQMICLETAK